MKAKTVVVPKLPDTTYTISNLQNQSKGFHSESSPDNLRAELQEKQKNLKITKSDRLKEIYRSFLTEILEVPELAKLIVALDPSR